MRIFLTIAVGMSVAACSNAPAGYPMTADQAYDRLKSADLNDFLFSRRCGVPIKGVAGGTPGKAVVWQVMSGGEERLRFTIALTPIDAQHTDVKVVEIKAREHDGEGYDGTQVYKRPVVQQPTRAAVEEQVAATMEGRPYNRDAAPWNPDDDVCDVQRAGSDGSARFSVNDRGPDSVRDSARRDAAYSHRPSARPGEPDPDAGKPALQTW